MRKLVAFACLCLQVGIGSGAPILLSAKTNLSVTAGGSSFAPVFSPDGRYLFFQSDANNIVADDVEGQALDLFMFDFDTSENRLVSAGDSGPAGMTGSAAYPSSSSNAMFVAFSTLAPLVPNDTNLVYDVYLRDVLHGTNLAVTIRADPFPFEVQTIGYLRPLLSIDGSKVLIETESPGVFLRDFATGSNISIRVGS